MAKKKMGINTKVAAANEKQAAIKAEKDAQKAAEMEKKLEKEWSEGANARLKKKLGEEEKKRQEIDMKAAELKKLQELEENEMSKIKLARSATRKTKQQKDIDKPWEAALKSVDKQNNRGSRMPNPTPIVPMTVSLLKPGMKNGIVEQNEMIPINLNRDLPMAEIATSVDEAINLLNDNKLVDIEKHPERRAKAAYKAFEEKNLPLLKEDYLGLKLSQYKQKLSEMWRKSPENPLNQNHAAYNEKKKN